MTERSEVWDGLLTGDASDAPYSATEWAHRTALLNGLDTIFPNYGVLRGTGGGTYPALSVQAKSPASTNVEVEIGSALVNGRLYENTAALTLAVGANVSGNPRIDTVLLRADFTAQTVRAVIKQGTPAGSPVRPTLQQDTLIWEMPLADIAVANGFSVINAADITNRKRAIDSLASGWQAEANPVSYPGGGANFDTLSITFPSTVAAKALPFILTGNMLLQDVFIRHITTVVTYTIEWGLYFQDKNDGNTSENTLRLVASGSVSGTTAGTQNISIPAIPAPQALAPGSYWLVLRTPAFSGGGLQIGVVASSNFTEVGYMAKSSVVGASLPQTLDMVTGWSTANSLPAVRLRGRVFGMSAVL